MQLFPHYYTVNAAAIPDGDVTLQAAGIPALRSGSPAEFDGPGDRWSPETLLVAAVGDCFILTFRAVARASKLPWTAVHCEVTGTLDRVERATQFTSFDLRVALRLPPGAHDALARRTVEKAEGGCLISKSLKAPVHLTTEIITDDERQVRSA
jgi:organic hydroperoxide reductase OsmC/OhrA